MYSKCDHCGEFAVDDSENIEVCKSCGVVIDETRLSYSEFVPSQRTFTACGKSEARLSRYKKKSRSLEHGETVLENLCQFNSISLYKPEIIELFKLVVSVRRFTKKEDAGIAAACCLFLFVRKRNQSIPVITLCKQVPCTKGKFSHFLRILKTFLSSNKKFKQYSDLLDYRISDTHENNDDEVADERCSDSLDNETSDTQEKKEDNMPNVIPYLIQYVCEKAEKEEKTRLLEKTTSLVKLAYSCWLFTGRSPRSVVTAAAFLCWKSMHPSRKKTVFSKFCSKFEISDPMAYLRVHELKSLLLKLGKMIPSRTENYVNEDNVLFHLNTILEHSETLRNDLFPDSYTGEEVDAVEFTNFRHPPAKTRPRKEPSDAVQYDSDMNASDIEISDSEIESYLVPNKKEIIKFCEKKKAESVK